MAEVVEPTTPVPQKASVTVDVKVNLILKRLNEADNVASRYVSAAIRLIPFVKTTLADRLIAGVIGLAKRNFEMFSGSLVQAVRAVKSGSGIDAAPVFALIQSYVKSSKDEERVIAVILAAVTANVASPTTLLKEVLSILATVNAPVANTKASLAQVAAVVLDVAGARLGALPQEQRAALSVHVSPSTSQIAKLLALDDDEARVPAIRAHGLALSLCLDAAPAEAVAAVQASLVKHLEDRTTTTGARGNQTSAATALHRIVSRAVAGALTTALQAPLKSLAAAANGFVTANVDKASIREATLLCGGALAALEAAGVVAATEQTGLAALVDNLLSKGDESVLFSRDALLKAHKGERDALVGLFASFLSLRGKVAGRDLLASTQGFAAAKALLANNKPLEGGEQKTRAFPRALIRLLISLKTTHAEESKGYLPQLSVAHPLIKGCSTEFCAALVNELFDEVVFTHALSQKRPVQLDGEASKVSVIPVPAAPQALASVLKIVLTAPRIAQQTADEETVAFAALIAAHPALSTNAEIKVESQAQRIKQLVKAARVSVTLPVIEALLAQLTTFANSPFAYKDHTGLKIAVTGAFFLLTELAPASVATAVDLIVALAKTLLDTPSLRNPADETVGLFFSREGHHWSEDELHGLLPRQLNIDAIQGLNGTKKDGKKPAAGAPAAAAAAAPKAAATKAVAKAKAKLSPLELLKLAKEKAAAADAAPAGASPAVAQKEESMVSSPLTDLGDLFAQPKARVWSLEEPTKVVINEQTTQRDALKTPVSKATIALRLLEVTILSVGAQVEVSVLKSLYNDVLLWALASPLTAHAAHRLASALALHCCFGLAGQRRALVSALQHVAVYQRELNYVSRELASVSTLVFAPAIRVTTVMAEGGVLSGLSAFLASIVAAHILEHVSLGGDKVIKTRLNDIKLAAKALAVQTSSKAPIDAARTFNAVSIAASKLAAVLSDSLGTVLRELAGYGIPQSGPAARETVLNLANVGVCADVEIRNYVAQALVRASNAGADLGHVAAHILTLAADKEAEAAASEGKTLVKRNKDAVASIEQVIPSFVSILTRPTTPLAVAPYLARGVSEAIIAHTDTLNATDARKACEKAFEQLCTAFVKTETTMNSRKMIAAALTDVCQNVAFATIPAGMIQSLDFVVLRAVDVQPEPDVALTEGIFALVEAAVASASAEVASQLYTHVDKLSQQKTSSPNKILFSLTLPVTMAAIARHLNPSDKSILQLIARLMGDLFSPDAPNVHVQQSIGRVLAPLVRTAVDAGKLDGAKEIEATLKVCFDGSTRPVRIGGAIGVAALVKGMKSSSLRTCNVLAALEKAANDKNDPARKQGALYGYKFLAETLDRLFEPYVQQVLPVLLLALADAQELVRAPAADAGKAIMRRLSNYGVSRVVPDLVEKAADGNWRVKVGALELLGTMSQLAPRQLAAFLPKIIPTLVSSVGDSHNKVVAAAEAAIKSITEVITNPEVLVIAPQLVQTLVEPSEANQKKSLDALLSTTFIHAVCSPSLALICPVLQRALKSQDSTGKRKAAQVLAAILNLVKDPVASLVPYLDGLKPQLQKALLDPTPDVRFVAAKAFGTLAKGVGEEHLKIIDWLYDQLENAVSSVERSGAANGLTEVINSLDVSVLKQHLAKILHNASDDTLPAGAREGYLGLFVYLPPAIASEIFSPSVSKVLAVLLNGLSDEVDSVRDVALRAAHVVIKQFGNSHTALLLPPLEEGSFADDWKLRNSSVSLMGTLVTEVLRDGASGVDVMLVAGAGGGDGINVLSKERRMFVLSSLYVAKNDENRTVRNTANGYWKALVQNTPRTLRDLLPILMERLIRALSSSSKAKQRTASACLGDIVEKLGARVLPDLMPVFMDQLEKGDASARYGVCLGLAEVLEAAQRQLIISYLGELLPAVIRVLSDDDYRVRQAAARCACALIESHTTVSVATIIPSLLHSICCPPCFRAADMRGPRANAIDGLRMIMLEQYGNILPPTLRILTNEGDSIKSKDSVKTSAALSAVQFTVPEFDHDPLNVATLYAFAAISTVQSENQLASAASRMVAHFRNVLAESEKNEDESLKQEIRTAITETTKQVIDRVADDHLSVVLLEGFSSLKTFAAITDLSAAGHHKRRRLENEKKPHGEFVPENEFLRASACRSLAAVFEAAANASAPFIQQAILTLLPAALADISPRVREAAADAFSALARSVKKEEFMALLQSMQETTAQLAVDGLTNARMVGIRFPGFEGTSLLETLYPNYQHALMYGTPEQREVAAKGLGDLVDLSSDVAIKPYIVKMTGPFIRIVGDKYPPTVKAAILDSIDKLLKRGGAQLKPFVPQLQTTFAKCVGETHALVRYRAQCCLRRLAPLAGVRVEQLIVDLASHCALTSAASSEDQTAADIRTSGLKAIRDVLRTLPSGAASKLSDAAREKIVSALSSNCTKPPKGCAELLDDSVRALAARCLSLLLVRHRNEEDSEAAVDLIRTTVIEPTAIATESTTRAGCLALLTAVADSEDSWDELLDPLQEELSAALTPLVADYTAPVRKAMAELVAVLAYRAARAWNAGDQAAEGKLAFTLFFDLAEICQKNGGGGLLQIQPALRGIRSFLKRVSHGVLDETMGEDWLSRLSDVLVKAIQTPAPTLKLPSERTLWFALGGPTTVGTGSMNPEIVTRALKGMDTVRSGFLSEYVRRVLARLPADNTNSDVEENEEEQQ